MNKNIIKKSNGVKIISNIDTIVSMEGHECVVLNFLDETYEVLTKKELQEFLK